MEKYCYFHKESGYQPILRLPVNTSGRDFVMGDLHGEIEQLHQRLDALAFDRTVDRLFSVGDLVDRGKDSMACLRLLREPWFHCVMGNHEQMMGDYLLLDGDSFWLKNGGTWHFDLIKDGVGELLELVFLSRKLPCVIVVGEGEQRFQIVHAEMPYKDEYLEGLWDSDRVDVVLWSRRLAGHYRRWLLDKGLANDDRSPLLPEVAAKKPFYHPVLPGTSLTFCGHNQIYRPGLWCSHYYLDTGAGYESGRLTVLPVDALIQQYLYAKTLTTP